MSLRWIQLFNLLLAVFFISCVFWLFAMRASYPFELEWLEGGVLSSVWRILRGEALYIKPNIEFVPFIYPPLYYYLSALFASVFGANFFSLRLLSFVCTIASFVVLFVWVKKETQSKLSAALALGFFAATLPASGAWFDVARVDMLALFLLLAAAYVFRFYPSLPGQLVSASLFFLSYFSKQSVLVLVIALSLYALYAFKGFLKILLPLCFFLLVALSTIIMDGLSDSWYSFYVFKLPAAHPWLKEYGLLFWLQDIAEPFFLAVLLGCLSIRKLYLSDKAKGLFYVFFAIGLFSISWLGRLHIGGFDNVLIPAHLALGLLVGLGVSGLVANKIFSAEKLSLLVQVLLLFQFITLVYNPAKYLPAEKDQALGERLVDIFSKEKFKIFVPFHGYLAELAGKQGVAHANALIDVFHASNPKLRQELESELRGAFRKQNYSLVLVDKEWALYESLELGYEKAGEVFSSEDAFFPPSGLAMRPELLFLPHGENQHESFPIR